MEIASDTMQEMDQFEKEIFLCVLGASVRILSEKMPISHAATQYALFKSHINGAMTCAGMYVEQYREMRDEGKANVANSTDS